MVQNIDYGAASGSGKTPQTVTYTYDDEGREATVTDASGTTTYSYDAFGNQSVVASPEGAITYTYDPATGNHVETQTSNSDIAYGYDPKGELTTVTVKELNGSVLSAPLITTYTYDVRLAERMRIRRHSGSRLIRTQLTCMIPLAMRSPRSRRMSSVRIRLRPARRTQLFRSPAIRAPGICAADITCEDHELDRAIAFDVRRMLGCAQGSRWVGCGVTVAKLR
jgi:YD repeat-containing protein